MFGSGGLTPRWLVGLSPHVVAGADLRLAGTGGGISTTPQDLVQLVYPPASSVIAHQPAHSPSSSTSLACTGAEWK